MSGDGLVVVNDIVMLVKSLQADESKRIPLEDGAQSMAADVSQDGLVAVNDAILIRQKINKWSMVEHKWTGEYISMVR